MPPTERKKLSATAIASRKGGTPLVMLTGYDVQIAKQIEASGADLILVGDSLGMVFQGHPNTTFVTVDEIIYHGRVVKRGAPNTHIVADLPFLTYHTSDEQALRNAGRLLQEGGADSVKLEGGEAIAPRIRALVDAGIPVMAHVGLGPQSVGTLGGFRLQGRDLESARRVIADAEAVAQAGAYAVVIEMVPAEVTELITSRIAVPTIGIGAGPACDGQVLIYADIIGLDPSFKLKLARRYAEVGRIIGEAFTAFGDDVRGGRFPSEDETFHLDPEIAADLRDHLASS